MHRALAATLALCASISAAHAEHVCRYCDLAAAGPGGPSGAPRYAPDRVVDVEHIKIDVTPDFAAKTIRATTTITFAPISKPTRLVELNAVDLWVEGVVASRPLAEHASDGERLTLLFEEAIPPGEEVEVAIAYTAEPKRGLYFRTADMGYPEGEDHIWTQGEPHEASHWFPCFDSPNERSTTEVICRVPKAMTVLSNGRRMGESVDAATGLKAVRWMQEKPHVSYLVCLCAGHFAKLSGESNGVDLGFYTQPSLVERAGNSFQDTAAILAFFEEEIGVAYPWAKYDQVTIRDYSWGGMENTTLTTLTHETVYSPDATENLRQSRNLDAHELAHQWFGDYVTCKDWSHLWLNEGFATYYTHLYDGHKYGRDQMLYRLYTDATERVLPAGGRDSRPIVYRNYQHAWQQFDYRAYPKGSWVLHMLRSRFGADLYREAVKLYLERHALSSVVTDDLRRAFEEVTGEPLDAFFDQWVYHPGAPELTVSHKWLAEEKLLRVTVEQGEPAEGQPTHFTFPVTLRAHVGDEVVDRRVDVDEPKQDFYLALPAKPDVVRFDPEFTLLAEVEHDKSQEMLAAQLELTGDVIGRVLAARALGEKDNAKATAALAAALEGDPFYGVRIAASRALGKQRTPAALEALLANRDAADARVRDRVVRDLGRFYFSEAATEALTAIASASTNPDIRGTALIRLARLAEEPINDKLLAELEAETLHNRLAIAAATAVGERRDEDLAEPLLRMLKDRRHELPARRYGEALVALAKAWRDADDKSPALRWLQKCLSDPANFVQSGAARALGELGDDRAKAMLSPLAERGDRTGGAAREALAKLDKDAPLGPTGVKQLRDEVRELREDHAELKKTVELLEAAGESEGEEQGES